MVTEFRHDFVQGAEIVDPATVHMDKEAPFTSAWEKGGGSCEKEQYRPVYVYKIKPFYLTLSL